MTAPVVRRRGRKGELSPEAAGHLAAIVERAGKAQQRATMAMLRIATGWGASSLRLVVAECIRTGAIVRVGRTKGAWYRIPEVQ